MKAGKELTANSKIWKLPPFLDQLNLSNQEFASRNPIILPGKQRYTILLVEKEHLRPLHAGPKLVAGSLAHKYQITGSRRIIHAVTHGCVTCKLVAGQPHPQLLGQLPPDKLNPGLVFDKLGEDYARPIMVKFGLVH